MEKGVMQSCWIQRLNPACQTRDFEVEESTGCSHVWTHFTKDFSSCSKRLQKGRRRTRSSSWPPNKRSASCSPPPDLKPVEPVDVKEQYMLSREALPMFKEDNFRVPFQDGSESNDFCLKTGNLFSNQNSSCKSLSTLEALVPCSHAARTCDEFYEGESKGKGKLKSSASQHSQWPSTSNSVSDVGNLALFRKPRLKPKLDKESGSFLEFGSAGVLGDAPCEGKISAFELAHTEVHIRGSSPDEVIRTSLSPAFTGASADADDSLCTFPYLSKPAKLSKNSTEVVFGDTENKINEPQLGVALTKYSGQVCGKKMKTRRNFGFLHVVGQSKTLNQSQANPCARHGSCDVGCSHKVGVHDRGSGAAMVAKAIQRKHSVGLGGFATNAGPSVKNEFYDLQSFNTELRYNPAVADHPHNLKEDLITKLPLTRVSSEDFVRPSGRETSLDEYWVQLFEGSAPQGGIIDESHRFNINSTKNIGKPDEKEKSKSFQHPNAHIPVYNNDQIYNSRHVPQQTEFSRRNSFIQTKQTGLGHAQSVSATRSPLQGTSILRTVQEESLQGGMRRLAPKTDKNELLCADEKMTEPSGLSQAWIRRWRSSNLIAMSGKSFSPSLGMDKELGSAPAKHSVFTICEGEKGMDYFDRKMQQCGRRTSKLHMDSSAGHDSGLGASPRGAFPVYRSHASLRGQNIARTIEAMAIVGNRAGKLHTTSVQNRGAFSVWPCPNDENCEEKGLTEPTEALEDSMHGMDIEYVKFLERKMR